ncbi:hypothetical protein V5799_030258, partial [Amblyomma americanum]
DELTTKETIPTQLTTRTTEDTSAVTDEDPRFKTAVLNCFIQGHIKIYIRTAAILELCLKIIVPTAMDKNGRIDFTTQITTKTTEGQQTGKAPISYSRPSLSGPRH